MAQTFLAWQALQGQDGHAVGRRLLAELYAIHVGLPLPEILTGDRGKPCFATGNWHFSISHSKNHAFCVLADRPVGIDAEEADRNIHLSIAPKILSPGELRQYEASEDPRDTLLRFWVLKEASAKRTGEGIGFHPRHTDFTLPDERITEIDGCLVAVVY